MIHSQIILRNTQHNFNGQMLHKFMRVFPIHEMNAKYF